MIVIEVTGSLWLKIGTDLTFFTLPRMSEAFEFINTDGLLGPASYSFIEYVANDGAYLYSKYICVKPCVWLEKQP